MNNTPIVGCEVFRCSRQVEMYLYLRQGLEPSELPEALLKRVGRLSRVMTLELTPDRKLARVDVNAVINRVLDEGWFLQLPPMELVQAHLQDGD